MKRAKYIIETFVHELKNMSLKLENGKTKDVLDDLAKAISKCNGNLAWLKFWFVALQVQNMFYILVYT